MQLSPHKTDTTLVSYFVASTTRFNSCVYLYCYNSPIEPQSRGHQYKFLIKQNLPIDIPSNLPTGRYPRGPPIDQASDRTTDLPSDPPTYRFPRRKNQDKINQTKPAYVTVSRSNSQSLSQSTDQDHERTPDLLIKPTIAR